MKILIVLFSFAFIPNIFGQDGLYIINTSQNDLPTDFQTRRSYQSKSQLKTIQSNLIADGYIGASIDSIKQKGDSLQAYLHLGAHYSFAKVNNGNISPEVSAKAGIREKLLSNKPINTKQISTLLERVAVGYENTGYPFAQIRLKIDSSTSDEISAHFDVNTGFLTTIDTIIIKGVDVNFKFLSNSIRIAEGDLYNQSLINDISNRIREISFLSEAKGAELVFRQNKAALYIYLKQRNANRFNGILGILPDRTTGKITLTGELKLNLTNAFNKGEEISFEWRKLQTQTQELKIGAYMPYIFGLPFGLSGNFDLYKRDSTYIEIQPSIELRYQLKGSNYFGVYFKNYQSRLLDPERFENSTVLPRFNDTQKSSIGLSLLLSTLDYRLNPRKGFDVMLKAGAGFKQILTLDQLDSSIYENIQLRTNHYELNGSAYYFLPLLKRTSFMVGAKASWLINDQIFINEMNRLGGLKSIRGFDDQSLLASSYVIGTAEYRFLLEQNSYVYLFSDFGYFENKNTEFTTYNAPVSFGAGISFQTKAGIFTINYALGRLENTQFLIRSAKIHFGFVNYF